MALRVELESLWGSAKLDGSTSTILRIDTAPSARMRSINELTTIKFLVLTRLPSGQRAVAVKPGFLQFSRVIDHVGPGAQPGGQFAQAV
jgi:hypothetical protein